MPSCNFFIKKIDNPIPNMPKQNHISPSNNITYFRQLKKLYNIKANSVYWHKTSKKKTF